MDYTTPKQKGAIEPRISALQKSYPHDLQMYKIPPKGEITLMEFQELALERQKVLQLLEVTLAQQYKNLEETKSAFINSLRKEGYTHYVTLLKATGCASHKETDLEARRRDHISHFILRLAYSLKEQLQNYFISYETELFKLRCNSMNKEGFIQFLRASGIHYTRVSQEFKESNREYLYAITARDADFDNVDFYELPFEEVVDLVSERKVYLCKGKAYVPQSEFIPVFLSHFRNNLNIELNKAKRQFLDNMEDERLQSFLTNLPECFAGMSKVVWSTDNTPISKLNDLSKTSYPPCMRVMHEQLTNNHHLKNTGRLQYGLFLKGIGVTLEDSIVFWKSELIKKDDCNEDKFNKNYLYNINYSYGKVGRRVNYAPHSCSKLITESVAPGDIHGCPFRHMDTDELVKKLTEFKITSTDVGEISKLSREGHYNLACLKYFESTHKQRPENIYRHPNGYFEESRKILTKDEIKDETITPDLLTPISPEKLSQPLKRKDNVSDTSYSVTPSRTGEKKSKIMDKKMHKMDPLNIEALLNDSD